MLARAQRKQLTCKPLSGGTAAAKVPRHRCWHTPPPPQSSSDTMAPCKQHRAACKGTRQHSAEITGCKVLTLTNSLCLPTLDQALTPARAVLPGILSLLRAVHAWPWRAAHTLCTAHPLQHTLLPHQAPDTPGTPPPYLVARSSASICCSSASKLCMSLCLNQRTRARLSLAPCRHTAGPHNHS